MYRKFVPALAAVCIVAPAPALAAGEIASNAEIQKLLDQAVKSGRVKGLAFGLIRPDGSRHILVAGSAGDRVGPVTAKSVFEIGSITKTFTGVLLAEAVRRGEVRLDDPLAKHLPANTKVPSRAGKQITLRHLATHRSGLPRIPAWNPKDDLNPYKEYKPEHLLAYLSSHELTRDIGTPEYSNLGAALLGLALVNAARAPDYRTLVQQRILGPLGMKATSFVRPENGMTIGHDKGGKPVPHWDLDGFAGAGGLVSDANDMLTYLDAHTGPPRTSLEQSMRVAQQPLEGIGKGDWKIGHLWQMRGPDKRRVVIHAGSTGGYGSYAAFNPQTGAAAVILGNTDDFNGDFVARLIATPEAQPTAADVPTAALADYVGTYELRPGFTLTVTSNAGKLFAQATGQGKLTLFPEAKDRFFVREVDANLTFDRDASGKVTAVTLSQNGRSLKGRRAK